MSPFLLFTKWLMLDEFTWLICVSPVSGLFLISSAACFGLAKSNHSNLRFQTAVVKGRTALARATSWDFLIFQKLFCFIMISPIWLKLSRIVLYSLHLGKFLKIQRSMHGIKLSTQPHSSFLKCRLFTSWWVYCHCPWAYLLLSKKLFSYFAWLSLASMMPVRMNLENFTDNFLEWDFRNHSNRSRFTWRQVPRVDQLCRSCR